MCTGTHGFIPANGVFNFKIWFDQFGSKMMNNLNILSGGGSAQADMDRIQLKLLDWLTTQWKPGHSNTASCALMQGLYLGVEFGIQKDYLVSPTVVGTLGTPSLPANVTVAVKLTTGIGGRSARGRIYTVGMNSASVSGNSLAAGAPAAFAAIYNSLITKLAAGGTVDKLAIVSYCSNGFWRINAQVLPVLSASCDVNLDSQRRRLTGRGI